MKPHIHAQSSAESFGGIPNDYIEIHNFLDSSKAHLADVRHRAILHSTFGCYIAEKVFGVTINNSDKQTVSVRDICEQHIFEDLGRIPSVQDWLSEMNLSQWMSRLPIEEEIVNEIKPEEITGPPEIPVMPDFLIPKHKHRFRDNKTLD